MSKASQDDDGKAERLNPFGRSEHRSEKFIGPPPKAGLAPGQLERKIVGQGKRRETLRKWKKDQE
jgi:hypothetical protein